MVTTAHNQEELVGEEILEEEVVQWVLEMDIQVHLEAITEDLEGLQQGFQDMEEGQVVDKDHQLEEEEALVGAIAVVVDLPAPKYWVNEGKNTPKE